MVSPLHIEMAETGERTRSIHLCTGLCVKKRNRLREYPFSEQHNTPMNHPEMFTGVLCEADVD
jgi:hypothetical protein